MKNKIITLGLAIIVAGSSAYGFGMRDTQNCGNSFQDNHKRGVLLNSHKNSNSMFDLMSAISNLELTRTQQVEIRKIMFDLREKNIEKMEDKNAFTLAFTKNGKFSKEDFIKSRVKFSEEMVEGQASMIEKILDILDEEQTKIVMRKLSSHKDS